MKNKKTEVLINSILEAVGFLDRSGIILKSMEIDQTSFHLVSDYKYIFRDPSSKESLSINTAWGFIKVNKWKN